MEEESPTIDTTYKTPIKIKKVEIEEDDDDDFHDIEKSITPIRNYFSPATEVDYDITPPKSTPVRPVYNKDALSPDIIKQPTKSYTAISQPTPIKIITNNKKSKLSKYKEESSSESEYEHVQIKKKPLPKIKDFFKKEKKDNNAFFNLSDDEIEVVDSDSDDQNKNYNNSTQNPLFNNNTQFSSLYKPKNDLIIQLAHEKMPYFRKIDEISGFDYSNILRTSKRSKFNVSKKKKETIIESDDEFSPNEIEDDEEDEEYSFSDDE